MKKITALLGLVGVVGMFSACTDTISNIDELIDEETVSQVSSDSKTTPSSSTPKDDSVTKTEAKSSSSGEATVDTITQTVYLSSASNYDAPYVSEGIFCWSEKCEASTATSSASMDTIFIGVSSEAQIFPTVTETQMVDLRDNQTYPLQTIAGTHWMAKNLNYATESGSFCSVSGGSDMCASYGRFYTLNAAKRACPAGWRLPSPEEVKAADAAIAESWWTLGGRFKYDGENTTEYGLDDQQGYWWLNNGASWRVQPSSDEHVEQSLGAADGRAYNVRCVEDKAN